MWENLPENGGECQRLWGVLMEDEGTEGGIEVAIGTTRTLRRAARARRTRW